MNVNLLAIPKRQAEKEYESYAQVLKQNRKEEYLEELKTLYRHLAKGKKIINIYDAFQKVGLIAEQNTPKLAIVQANAKMCYFEKREHGTGKFSKYPQEDYRTPKSEFYYDVLMPSQTYPEWETGIFPDQWNKGLTVTRIKNRILETRVPIVPARLLPKAGLHNYHIIWEVDKWNVRKAPVDPILVKRVTKNMFVVLAVWDLSPIEQAIIEGRE